MIDYDKLHGEDLDKALHDCITVLWQAYRASVTTYNAKPYNECFKGLYAKYHDGAVQRFIECAGMGLVESVNRRVHEQDE